MIIYRFDSVDEYRVLDSYTTVRGSITTLVVGQGDKPMLRVRVVPLADEALDAVVVIALPLVAIDGAPERLDLVVDGDASRCQLLLEGIDAKGVGLTYSFESADSVGVRNYSVDVARPVEVLSKGEHDRESAITPPIQLFRLVLTLGAGGKAVNLGLISLSVSGVVRLSPPGLA